MTHNHAHFKGSDALEHILKTKAKGSSSEPHGIEIPGHLFAATDTARALSLVILLLFTICYVLQLQEHTTLIILFIFSVGMLIGFCGRSAWIGWARLERLHRNLEQEHYEIEHHRPQEREELRVLYSQKGFKDPLLDQVVDVLMADDDRLLRVMLEEEMGFSLESYEHPLKQCFGALVGGVVAFLIIGITYFVLPAIFMLFIPLIIMGFAAGFSAHFEENKVIPSVVWSLGVGALALGIVYFTLQILL